MAERNLFRAKINSDYNDFVAWVALEVVESTWWKQQLRVKSAGQHKTLLIEGAARGGPYSCARFYANLVSDAVASVWHSIETWKPTRKRVQNSNANENKQLISPSIAQNAICAANFAPFLHFFLKIIFNLVSSQLVGDELLVKVEKMETTPGWRRSQPSSS